MTDNADSTMPLYASVERACELLGVTRTWLYEAIGEGRIDTRKAGRRTLIDMASAKACIDALPPSGGEAAWWRRVLS
jgi:excisionase family DNA binding protein